MALKHVDPTKPKNAFKRGMEAFVRSKAGLWLGTHVAERIDPWLMRRTGGKVRLAPTLPTVVLRVKGAKSGVEREVSLLYFHDGSDVVLIASSFGREKLPAWYFNLRANPACTLNGAPYVATEVSDEGEYERLFELGCRNYGGYADYRAKIAGSRHIPVLRLSPA